MNDSNIRQLIQQEIYKARQAGSFNLQSVNRHAHNNISSNPINQSDVVPGQTARGLITFTQSTVYTLGITFNPTSLFIYGNAVHRTAGTIDIRAFIIGDAKFAPSFYFQKSSTTAVTTGGKLLSGNPPPQQLADGSYANTIVQSSSYFAISGNGVPTTPVASADQFHLVRVDFSGLLASADVISFSKSAIEIATVLADGWEINANYIVT